MDFFIGLVILFILLAAVIWAFGWLYEKYWPKKAMVQPQYQPSVCEIYQQYRADYENVAGFVWMCLSQSRCRYGLDIPGNIEGIFCDEVVDRISLAPDGFLFQYEVPLLSQGGFSSARNRTNNQTANFVQILENNLPSYFDAGYSFDGPIHVLSISHNRIRIEIHGVNREMPMWGGEMWW